MDTCRSHLSSKQVRARPASVEMEPVPVESHAPGACVIPLSILQGVHNCLTTPAGNPSTTLDTLVPATAPLLLLYADTWARLHPSLRRYFLEHPLQYAALMPLAARAYPHTQDPVVLDTLGYETCDEFGPYVTNGRRWRFILHSFLSVYEIASDSPEVHGGTLCALVQCMSAECSSGDDASLNPSRTASLWFTPTYKWALCANVLHAAIQYHTQERDATTPHLPVYGGSIAIRVETPLELPHYEKAPAFSKFFAQCKRAMQHVDSHTGALHLTYQNPLVQGPERDTSAESVQQGVPRETRCLSFALQLTYALASLQVAVPDTSLAFQHLNAAHMTFVLSTDRDVSPFCYQIVPHKGDATVLQPIPPSLQRDLPVLQLAFRNARAVVNYTKRLKTRAAANLQMVSTPPEYLFFASRVGTGQSSPAGTSGGACLHSTTFSAGMLIVNYASSLQDPAIRSRAGVVSAFLKPDGAWMLDPPTSFIHACTRPHEPIARGPVANLTADEASYVWNLVEMIGFPPMLRTTPQSTKAAGGYTDTPLLRIIIAHEAGFKFARRGRGWLIRAEDGSIDEDSEDGRYETWLAQCDPALAAYAAGIRKTIGILGVSVKRMLSWHGRDRNRPLNQLLVDSRNISHGVKGFNYAQQFHISSSRFAEMQQARDGADGTIVYTLDTKSIRATSRQRGRKTARSQYYPMICTESEKARVATGRDPVIPGTDLVPYYHRADLVHAQTDVSAHFLLHARKFYGRARAQHLSAPLSPPTSPTVVSPGPDVNGEEPVMDENAAAYSLVSLTGAPTSALPQRAVDSRGQPGVIGPPLRCRQCERAAHLAVAPIPFCSNQCYHAYLMDPTSGRVPQNPPPLVTLRK